MRIRKAVPEDAEAAAILMEMAIGDIAKTLTAETELPAILDCMAAFFRQGGCRIGYEQTIAAEEDGRLAGIITVYGGRQAEQLDEPIADYVRRKTGQASFRPELETELHDFYLDTLCVAPEFRGKRIAQKLIAAAEELALASGYTRMSLNCEEHNETARRLYERLGYKKDSIRMLSGHSYDYMVKTLEEKR